MSTILGIDLGTSTAVAAVLEEGFPTIVRNQQGSSTTPMVVSRSVVGEWYAGQEAKRLAVMHPRETAWDFLRLLGKRFDSPEVRNAAGLAPFAIVEGLRGDACLRMGGETVHPAALVSLVLAKLKAAAEAQTGRALADAIVAVPAYFHSGQRRLVAEAARLAGLSTPFLHAASSVAALAPDVPPGLVVLCDLGGGSFGVSVVESTDGIVQVLARDWESFLGGEDFDQLIVRRLLDGLSRDEGIDASMDPVVLAHMREAGEKAKRRLSVVAEVEIDVPLGATGLYRTTLTRGELEALLEPQLEWLSASCSRALKAAGVAKTDVSAVLTLGGSTRIPRVLQKIGELFGMEPTSALHPEEAPALGAAVRGGMLTGEVPHRVFMDVQSHDLGIEYPRGNFAVVVERNETIPTKRERSFLTSESRIDVRVLEGASSLASECLSLGRIVWELPFRRKESEVGVELEVDVTGRVEATVSEPSSGIRHRVTPRLGSDLSAEEMARYRSELERYQARLMAEKVSYVTAPARLTVLGTAEKVMAALNGDRRTRLKLVLDPDRAVWSAVLESPRTTLEDVVAMFALEELAPDVLREIAANPDWSKRYEIVLALVTHRSSPTELALKLVDRLRTLDLEKIIADDSLSAVLRAQCRALMKMRF